MSFSRLANMDERTGCGGHYSPARFRKGYDFIILHHNGSTNFNAVPAVWRNRPASAHYQVGPGAIKACLDEELVSWNAGNWDVNTRSIAIENVDADMNWNIDPRTEETCAELVAEIATRRGIPIDRQHIKGHNEVRVGGTDCPGRLRVDWVVNRAREIAGLGIHQEATPVQTAVNNHPQEQSKGWLFFDYRGNVRKDPTTNSPVMATYSKGTWVRYDGWVHGQSINGNDQWLRTANHKWYVHSSVTGGVFGLPELDSAPAPAPAPSQGNRVPQQGTYRANFNMKIRRAPSLNGEVAGTFSAGATQHYDSYVDNEGIRWVSWVGASGHRNYVARRKLDNSTIYGVCF